jgi:hypothetical protein
MSLDVLRRGVLLAAGVVLGLAMLTPAQAAQDEKKEKKGKPQQVVPTGREDAAPATAAEAAGEALVERMVDRTVEGLRSYQYDDGTVGVDLDGRFMHVSVVSRRPDGSLAVSCVGNHKGLAHAKLPAPPAAKAAKPAPVALEEK